MLHQRLRASHIATRYSSDCFSYFCFIGYGNSCISKAEVKHSIRTTAIAPTGPVKIDFIWLSLKPDRGNQVICSPTSLPLLVAAVVPNSCKIQPAEKQTRLKRRAAPARLGRGLHGGARPERKWRIWDRHGGERGEGLCTLALHTDGTKSSVSGALSANMLFEEKMCHPSFLPPPAHVTGLRIIQP